MGFFGMGQGKEGGRLLGSGWLKLGILDMLGDAGGIGIER